MLKNYFKIAWRSLLKNKTYSIINIAGLAVGIACCVLITIYVKGELSYDRYHKNVDHIYRVLHAYRHTKAGEKLPTPSATEFQVWGNAPVGPALAADFPEIKKVVQFTSPVHLLLKYQEKSFQENDLLFMDSTVFDVFSWKMLAGNPGSALKATNSIVLTETMAQKYFGNSNPVGQIIQVGEKDALTVTGVMEDVPANSHFTFSGLISMSTFQRIEPGIFQSWGYVDFYTYLLLANHTNVKNMEGKLASFIDRHQPENMDNGYAIALEPLTAAYLHSVAGRQPGAIGSLSNVYIFSVIAVFILLIACINFMNLSTARSLERAKEVGVRKAVGAFQDGLIYQFLTESVVISLIAVVLAIVLSFISLPLLREISGKPFPVAAFQSRTIIALFILIPFVVGILAGSYPAWVLSRFRPAEVLKGKFRSSGNAVMLRKGLVVLQFSLSIALIASTLIVFFQLEHLRTYKKGFKQDQMLVIDYGGDNVVNKQMEVIKTALARDPGVLSVSASRSVPGDFIPNAGTNIEMNNGAMQSYAPTIYEIDFDFIPVYDLKLAAGRAYSRDFPADAEQSLMVNEATAKLYGYANPEDIVGKRFEQWGRKGNVVGVLKDFNYQSLHKKVEPLVLRIAYPDGFNKISLHIKPDHVAQTIAAVEKSWAALVPHHPFLYSFLDESFQLQYQQDQRFGKIFGLFAGLTIFIACLGLFGLATYATEQRVKEIGIRKVLGASVTNITTLLSTEFVKLVLLAILIATPVAWWGMNKWLNDFAYHIDIQWWVFAFAGMVAVMIALLTVGGQALKAALMNPVRALRSE
ncbi:ABC transporter permease [Chitinophaga defluvii]|uniref:ABC transporter permease n=1 Tax=Chitinophaga defluvii TaxID=3163343 RepID=A0ABV2TAD6_9BACT